jgi:tetratricopeptide (TPR) repeat protein
MNYSAYLWLAIYYEMAMDDEEKAKEYNEKAFAISPPRQEHCLFNRAYFFINDYDFKSAIEIYEKLARWDHQTNYNQMRNILFKKYEKTKNLGFLFAEAFVASVFQKDEIYGKRKLREFIKKVEKSKDSIDYSALIEKATALIK